MADTLLTFPAKSFDPDTQPIVAGDDAAYLEVQYGIIPVLVYPDGSTEHAAVTPVVTMPQAYAAGTLKARITAYNPAASNDWVFEVRVESIANSEAMAAAGSFDSANSGTIAVSGTANEANIFEITLTNKDSVAAGEAVRFHLRRSSNDGSDDNTGECWVANMEIEES